MKMKKLVMVLVIAAIIAVVSVSFYMWMTRPREFKGTVVKIIDGDSIVVKNGDKEEEIRLADIDTPEKEQTYGKWAKEYVAMFTRSREVTVKHQGQHAPGGALIAEVILEDGASLNKMMVSEGVAWYDSQHFNDEKYKTLEDKAKSSRKGLWRQKDPEPPWIWRKKNNDKKNW